jgi:hypothetical protein
MCFLVIPPQLGQEDLHSSVIAAEHTAAEAALQKVLVVSCSPTKSVLEKRDSTPGWFVTVALLLTLQRWGDQAQQASSPEVLLAVLQAALVINLD